MTEIVTTRGSDVELLLAWKLQNGDPLPLADYTVSVLEHSAELKDRVSAEISDALTGRVLVKIEGTDPIRVATHSFRIQVTSSDGTSLATGLIKLKVE